jgi:hypothetical protein
MQALIEIARAGVLRPDRGLAEQDVARAEDTLDETDQFRVRADVVQHIAGERELDLQVFRIFVDRAVTLRRRRQFLGGGKILKYPLPRVRDLVGGQKAGHDDVAVAQILLGLLVGDPHGDACSALERFLQPITSAHARRPAMATKRNTSGKRKAGRSGKTDPEQVSGISAAAIEGASQASDETSDNAEKMARPGPGLDIGRRTRLTQGSPPSDESSAPESGTVRDVESDRPAREASPDEI